MRKNKILSVMTAVLLLCLIAPMQLMAETGSEERQLPRLVDNAGLLNGFEAEQVLEYLDQVSEKQKMDVAIVTESSLGGKDAQVYADDFYDDNGYGMGEDADGILLLISMSEREWVITTYGKAIDVFSEWELEKLEDSFRPDLSAGRYQSAFMEYARLVEKEIERYDAAHRFPFFKYFGGALVIGLVLGLVTVSYMKRQLKTVRPQRAAANYVTPGSLHVTGSGELFLYRTVNRRERPKENSSSGSHGSGSHSAGRTHTSSSGRSHGGARGRF